MAFTKMEDDLNIIQKLADEPNDVGGMTATELKAKFDEGSKAVQKYINDVLIPRVLGQSQIITLPVGKPGVPPGADGWEYENGMVTCTVDAKNVTTDAEAIFVSLYLDGADEEVDKSMRRLYVGNIVKVDQLDGALKFWFRRRPLVALKIAVTIT